MKELIKNWLGLNVEKPDYSAIEKRTEEITKEAKDAIGKLDWFMREYHASLCDWCKRPFLAHYGGFYTSRKENGHTLIHCSSKCMDEYEKSNP